jgi:hypothetical protein
MFSIFFKVRWVQENQVVIFLVIPPKDGLVQTTLMHVIVGCVILHVQKVPPFRVLLLEG